MNLARAVAVTLCLVQLGVLFGACSASHKAAPPAPGTSASSAPGAGTLVVLASTQLKPAFEQLETQFAAANPGVAVTTTYQGSQALATAVQAGAQGDLFATDADPMAALAAAGAVVTTTVATFARNQLEIVVPV
ncbi:MAG TPA: extracellular solute-binding protein, partial [Actinomycetota bacterium]|nr:extracellular solute-binding protein [Actinomycetota bacterium]